MSINNSYNLNTLGSYQQVPVAANVEIPADSTGTNFRVLDENAASRAAQDVRDLGEEAAHLTGDALYHGANMARRTTNLFQDGAQAAVTGTYNFVNQAVKPALRRTAVVFRNAFIHFFHHLRVGFDSTDVVNMQLKSFTSFMTLLHESSSDKAARVYKKLYPLSTFAAQTSSVLSAFGMFKKIDDITRMIASESKTNCLKLASKVCLLGSDVISNIKILVRADLVDAKYLARDVVRFNTLNNSYGISLGETQAGLCVAGFSLNMADTVRRVVNNARVEFDQVLGITADILKISSVVASRLPTPAAPAISAATNLAANLIGIGKHYAQVNRFNPVFL